MKIREGNLITLANEGYFDVIIHGCNCFCTMGAGIAKHIKNAFPQAYQADLQTKKGDRSKLGTYSSATINASQQQITIVNAYTQFHWRGKKPVDYQAIEQVFLKISQHFSGQRMAYPLIGAGLAGGDWSIIAKIIGQALDGQDHTLVVLPNPDISLNR